MADEKDIESVSAKENANDTLENKQTLSESEKANENATETVPTESAKPENIGSDSSDDDYGTTLYYDDEDDDTYHVYDGKEALKIIVPTEYTQEEKEHQNNKESKKSFKETFSNFDFSTFIFDLIGKIPNFVEHTGEITINIIKNFFEKYGSLIAIPFVLLFGRIKKALFNLKEFFASLPSDLAQDVKDMSYEIRIIGQQVRKSGSKKYSSYFNAMRKYIVISFSRHSLIWKTVFNTVFPIVIAIISFAAFSSLKNAVVALEVIYNDEHIGYIESEEVFESAKSLALGLFPSDEDDSYVASLQSEPVYKISRISPTELSDENIICQQLIEASDASLSHACGIYIDGEFLCAVKNEADAISVFDSILAPSKKRAKEGTTVGFVEQIEYKQGLYPQSSIKDTLTLKKTLNSPKSEAQYHKVKKGETKKTIAQKYNLTSSQLKALNSSVNFKELKAGTKLLVAAQTEYVRVKVMKTRTTTQTVKFETVKKESSSLTKGTTKTTQEGRNGKYVITELVTYIDGVETYSTVVSKKQTVAPVNKIVLVGTKTISYSSSSSYSSSYSSSSSSSSSYSYSSSGMIWPTRGAYNLSSRYGYRSASISGWSFHGGVDIVKSGGGSTGTPVVAAASGTVVTAISGYTGYGHTVVIDHGNGLRTRYAHMQAGSICVRVGQKVYQGQQIGRIGGTGNVTGPHLHFEVLKNGTKVNPLPYIR